MTPIDPVWAGVAELPQAFGTRTLFLVGAVDALLDRIRRHAERIANLTLVQIRLAAENGCGGRGGRITARSRHSP